MYLSKWPCRDDRQRILPDITDGKRLHVAHGNILQKTVWLYRYTAAHTYTMKQPKALSMVAQLDEMRICCHTGHLYTWQLY